VRVFLPGALLLVLALPAACESDVHVHDHTPQHGGVVAMSGERHVEALVRRDGMVRFWVTDFSRGPVPLDGVRARATFRRADRDSSVVALVAHDGALEARTGPLDSDLAEIRFEAVLPGEGDGGEERLMVDFTLPVAAP